MDPLRKLAKRAKDNRSKLFRPFQKQSVAQAQPENDSSSHPAPELKLQYKRSTCDSEASVAESAIDVQQAPYDRDECSLLERRYPGLEPFMQIEGLQDYVVPLTLHAVKYDWSQVKGWDVAQLEENIRHMEFLGEDASLCAATLARAEVNGLTFMAFDEESLRAEGIPELPAKLLCRLIQTWKGQFGPLVETKDGVPAEIDCDWPTREQAQILQEADRRAAESGEGAVYGELIVLGYKEYRVHGSTWHPVGARNEKFALKRNKIPTGIKLHKVMCETPDSSQPAAAQPSGDNPSHVISMTFTATDQAEKPSKVSFQYVADRSKDMFQVGRMLVPQNDFVVRGPLHMDSYGALCGPVSRYACRIECERLPPFRTFIYAAGFNDKQQIFLSENAPKWQQGDRPEDWDALTTFGVRVWRPDTRVWQEVSVNGNMYEPRTTMTVAGARLESMTNELIDGSIIDLAGIQLLFQSADSMKRQQSFDPVGIVRQLNSRRPQCPVMMHTIYFDVDKSKLAGGQNQQQQQQQSPAAKRQSVPLNRQPYVFPACGHVHGYAPELIGKPCPLCRTPGPFVALNLENEPALCDQVPDVVFHPCGHAVTEEVAKFWSELCLPDNAPPNARYRPICPYCARPLRQTDKGLTYSKLIFQERGTPSSDSPRSILSGDFDPFDLPTAEEMDTEHAIAAQAELHRNEAEESGAVVQMQVASDGPMANNRLTVALNAGQVTYPRPEQVITAYNVRVAELSTQEESGSPCIN